MIVEDYARCPKCSNEKGIRNEDTAQGLVSVSFKCSNCGYERGTYERESLDTIDRMDIIESTILREAGVVAEDIICTTQRVDAMHKWNQRINGKNVKVTVEVTG